MANIENILQFLHALFPIIFDSYTIKSHVIYSLNTLLMDRPDALWVFSACRQRMLKEIDHSFQRQPPLRWRRSLSMQLSLRLKQC